jgi:hypothetical protein
MLKPRPKILPPGLFCARGIPCKFDPLIVRKGLSSLPSVEDSSHIGPNDVRDLLHLHIVETAVVPERLCDNLVCTVTATAPAPTPTPTAPTPGTPPTPPSGVASAFSPDWEKPAPNSTTFAGPDGDCGPTGDGGDSFTNARKNRGDDATSPHEVTWKALQSLPFPAHAPRSLAQWTS